MADAGTKVRLCSTDDVDLDSVIQVEVDEPDLVLAVYNVDGNFYVTDDQCTHGPGSLSEGELSGHVIECDFHYGAFDVRTGEVAAPPCMVPVKTYKVVVENDEVFIEV